MVLYILFGFIIVLLIALTATAAYFAIQKKDEESDDFPSIHQSGAFSIVRRSPSEALKEKVRTLNEIKTIVSEQYPEKADTLAPKYLALWELMSEESVTLIEEGDNKGVQTYTYDVPKNDLKHCDAFARNTYVTREQLQNYPEIIPPFYLGCRVKLSEKNAWNTNLDGTGWKPLLPSADGKYPIPDWRTIVEL